MEKVYFNGVVIDRCPACQGILFDNGELSRFFKIFMKQKPEVMDNLKFIDTYCQGNSNDKFINQEFRDHIRHHSDTEHYVINTGRYGIS